MPQFALIARSFDKSLAKLGHRDRRDVSVAVMQLRLDPDSPGLKLKRLSHAKDRRIHTIRANRDVRIVLARDGALNVLLYVAHHDPAIAWAVTRKLKVNPRTGVLQIYEDVDEAGAAAVVCDQAVVEVAPEPVVAVPAPTSTARPIFSDVSDDDLLAHGLPAEWLRRVRAIREADELSELEDRIPEEAWLALVDIATGGSPEAPRPLAEGDDPWLAGDARRRFRVMPEETDLAAALERDWPEWAVWLHPEQADAAERDWAGPARISGGPGTGKTVVLMHRAARRARAGATVLLLTYSAPLAKHLSNGVDLLLDGQPDARRHIEVVHLHGLAVRILRDAGEPATAVDDARLAEIVAEEAGDIPGAADPAFLAEEWGAVIDFWGVRRRESYLRQPRAGRAKPLSASERERLWDVFGRVHDRLAAEGAATWSDLCERAAAVVRRSGVPRFDDVLVDEAQDLGPRELAFAMELSARGGRGALFAGDVAQTIYRYPFAWSRVGVDVRGRARRLRVNYRTAGRIRRWADARMPRDLSDLGDGRHDGAPDVNLFEGPADPELHLSSDPEARAAALLAWLDARVAQGFGPEEIAVLAEDRAKAIEAVKALGRPSRCIGDGEEGAIQADSLAAAKGLEFRGVAMLLHDLPPDVAAADPRHAALVYMGATRARDALLVVAPSDPREAG